MGMMPFGIAGGPPKGGNATRCGKRLVYLRVRERESVGGEITKFHPMGCADLYELSAPSMTPKIGVPGARSSKLLPIQSLELNAAIRTKMCESWLSSEELP